MVQYELRQSLFHPRPILRNRFNMRWDSNFLDNLFLIGAQIDITKLFEMRLYELGQSLSDDPIDIQQKGLVLRIWTSSF